MANYVVLGILSIVAVFVLWRVYRWGFVGGLRETERIRQSRRIDDYEAVALSSVQRAYPTCPLEKHVRGTDLYYICKRKEGHEGPCAALPVYKDIPSSLFDHVKIKIDGEEFEVRKLGTFRAIFADQQRTISDMYFESISRLDVHILADEKHSFKEGDIYISISTLQGLAA